MRSLWLTAAIMAHLFGFIGCTRAPVNMISAPDGLEVPILRETGGALSAIAKPLRATIHTAGQAAQFPIDLPPADFTREMILVAAMGPAPDPICSIRIRRVRRVGNRLRADVEQRYPPAGRRRRPGSASPYHAIVIPRTTLTVVGFSAQLPPNAFDYGRGGR